MEGLVERYDTMMARYDALLSENQAHRKTALAAQKVSEQQAGDSNDPAYPHSSPKLPNCPLAHFPGIWPNTAESGGCPLPQSTGHRVS